MTSLPDFDALVDLYERYRTGYSDELYDAVLAAAPAEPAILDLAAGTGLSSRPLSRHADRLVAADVAPRMLARAPVRDKVLARAEALPFADDSFGLVTCAQAFHWLDPAPTYRELHRVLSPHGLAAIWWKYPAPDDEVRQRTDSATERVLDETPQHTPLVEGPLPATDRAPFRIETRDIPFTMTYTLADWLGYQASRRILRNMATDETEHAAVLDAIEAELREAFPDGELPVHYVQHLHLLDPQRTGTQPP